MRPPDETSGCVGDNQLGANNQQGASLAVIMAVIMADICSWLQNPPCWSGGPRHLLTAPCPHAPCSRPRGRPKYSSSCSYSWHLKLLFVWQLTCHKSTAAHVAIRQLLAQKPNLAEGSGMRGEQQQLPQLGMQHVVTKCMHDTCHWQRSTRNQHSS